MKRGTFIRTKETRQKISEANLRRPLWLIQQIAEKNRGSKRTPETCLKISLALKGQKRSEEIKQKLREAAKHRPLISEETRRKRSESLKGARSSGWRGGIHPEHERVRNSVEMKLWREKVFARDDFRCLDCGERGGQLQADHIYPFSLFLRLRFMLENGRTLCVDCHKKTDTYGWKTMWNNKKMNYI